MTIYEYYLFTCIYCKPCHRNINHHRATYTWSPWWHWWRTFTRILIRMAPPVHVCAIALYIDQCKANKNDRIYFIRKSKRLYAPQLYKGSDLDRPRRFVHIFMGEEKYIFWHKILEQKVRRIFSGPKYRTVLGMLFPKSWTWLKSRIKLV